MPCPKCEPRMRTSRCPRQSRDVRQTLSSRGPQPEGSASALDSILRDCITCGGIAKKQQGWRIAAIPHAIPTLPAVSPLPDLLVTRLTDSPRPAGASAAPVLPCTARCPDEVPSYEVIRAPVGEPMKNTPTRTAFLRPDCLRSCAKQECPIPRPAGRGICLPSARGPHASPPLIAAAALLIVAGSKTADRIADAGPSSLSPRRSALEHAR